MIKKGALRGSVDQDGDAGRLHSRPPRAPQTCIHLLCRPPEELRADRTASAQRGPDHRGEWHEKQTG